MPGRHVTDQQVRNFMSNVKKQGVALASMKAGFGKSTGYRILSRGGTKPVKKPRTSRCPDPLAGIFDAEVVPLLERAPDIRPVTVFQKLMEEHPELSPGVRRTLERRVRAWKAENGPGKAVIFPQTEVPGRTGISDFTHMKKLGVTIGGKPSDHMLYHFRLPWSGFGHAEVVLGGESFAALSEYLQKGLAAVGGVPREHRTDSLSAAFRNAGKCAKEDMTQRYRGLCAAYGMVATRNNPGIAHENGAIESPHGHLKRAVADALTVRGGRDFESLEAYRSFIADIVSKGNARRADKIEEERQLLKPLPIHTVADYDETAVRISRASGFFYRRVFYSVPSRLVRLDVKLRVYDSRIEIFRNGKRLLEVERKRFADAAFVINYRHFIGELVRKPGALARLKYRDQLFPRVEYRKCYEAALQSCTEREAAKLVLGLLYLAHTRCCEAELAAIIGNNPSPERLPVLKDMIAKFSSNFDELPKVSVAAARLRDYAGLCPQGSPQ